MTRNPTPLFILGRHRSGTTWLANALATLPEVYAPEHASPRKTHESAFFSHLVRHCNHGRTESDLREIKRLFEHSRFFALTGQAQGPDIKANEILVFDITVADILDRTRATAANAEMQKRMMDQREAMMREQQQQQQQGAPEGSQK